MASTKSKNDKKRFTIVIVIAVIVISSALVFRFSDDIFGNPPGSEHIHAHFKVFLDGQAVEFNPFKNPEFSNANELIFMENSDWVIHRFAKEATLKTFFESMGFQFNSTCFVLSEPHLKFDRTSYCIDDVNTMKFFVNGKPNEEFENYVIHEGDKILISYGNQTDKAIRDQLATLGSVPYVPYVGLG